MKRHLLWMFVCAMSLGLPLGAQQKGNWNKWSDPNSAARGNCPDCAVGEAKVEVRLTVPHGVYVDIDNPPCGVAEFRVVAIPDPLKQAAARAFYAQDGGIVSGGVAQIALSLGDTVLNGLLRAGSNDAGEIGRLTRGLTNQRQVSNCARLIAVLPQENVEITRMTQGCDGGWCGFVSEPRTERVDANLFGVVTVMKNWSHDSDRSGWLRVYYRR